MICIIGAASNIMIGVSIRQSGTICLRRYLVMEDLVVLGPAKELAAGVCPAIRQLDRHIASQIMQAVVTSTAVISMAFGAIASFAECVCSNRGHDFSARVVVVQHRLGIRFACGKEGSALVPAWLQGAAADRLEL